MKSRFTSHSLDEHYCNSGCGWNPLVFSVRDGQWYSYFQPSHILCEQTPSDEVSPLYGHNCSNQVKPECSSTISAITSSRFWYVGNLQGSVSRHTVTLTVSVSYLTDHHLPSQVSKDLSFRPMKRTKIWLQVKWLEVVNRFQSACSHDHRLFWIK